MYVVKEPFVSITRRFRPGAEITDADLAELSPELREQYRERGFYAPAAGDAEHAAQGDAAQAEQPTSREELRASGFFDPAQPTDPAAEHAGG